MLNRMTGLLLMLVQSATVEAPGDSMNSMVASSPQSAACALAQAANPSYLRNRSGGTGTAGASRRPNTSCEVFSPASS